MKNCQHVIKYFFIGLLMVSMFSTCSWLNDCGECFTPPAGISLIILDEQTGENLLKPGEFAPDSIRFYYLNNEHIYPVDFNIFGDDSLRKIGSVEIGFISTGPDKTFFLQLNNIDTDTIYLDTRIVSEECCTWHETEQFTINGLTPDYNQENNSWVIYK